MCLSRNPILVKVALIVASIGLVLHVVGFASPYWYYYETRFVTRHGGVWKSCSYSEWLELSGCENIKGGSNEAYRLIAAQTVGLIGLFICFVGIIGIILKVCVKDGHSAMKHCYAITIVLFAAAAIFILIEMALLAVTSTPLQRENLSWSFALDVAGVGLIIISAVLICVPSGGHKIGTK